MKNTFMQWCLVAVLAAGITGCASSTPKPLDELGQSRKAVAQADTPDTREYARAELQTAKLALDLAERAFKAEKYSEAKRQSERTVVLADMAKAKAQAVKSQQALQQVDGNIKTMQQELGETTPAVQHR